MAKWRKSTSTQDAAMGTQPASTLLSAEEKAIAVASHQHTLLPLGDCLYALQASIPRLTRSSLRRLFQPSVTATCL